MKRPHVTPFNPDIAKVVRVASEPTPMARGGCMVNMFDPEGRKVMVQTPALRAPFGVSDYQGKLSMSLSCTPETEETLRALDRAVIQLVVENYPAWFRTSIDEATARSFFLSNLKDDARGRYAPTWRLPIPMYGQKCQMDVFDASRDEIQVKDIAKGNSAIVIVELVGLWFVDKKFGIKWKPVQAMVVRAEEAEGHVGFIDDDDDQASTKPGGTYMFLQD
jgi:hypothetical protein